MASASLFFVPDIDRNELKKTQTKVVNAFKETSRRIGKQFERDLDRGIKAGAKSGAKALRGGLLAGAAAAGAAALSTVAGGEQTANLVMDRANQVNEIRNLADALGIDRGNLAQLASVGAGSGMDVSDLRGVLVGFQAAFADREFSQFAGVADRQGLDQSFLAFLDIASQRTGSDRAGLLQRALGEEDSVLAGVLVNRIEQLRASGQDLNLQNLFQQATGSELTSEDLADRMNKASDALLDASQSAAGRFVELFNTDFATGVSAAQDLIAKQAELEREQIATIERRVSADILFIDAQIKASEAATEAIRVAEETAKEVAEKTKVAAEALDKAATKLEKIFAAPDLANPVSGLSAEQQATATRMGNIPGRTLSQGEAMALEAQARLKEQQTKGGKN